MAKKNKRFFYLLKVRKLNKALRLFKKDKNGITLISFMPLYILKAEFLIIESLCLTLRLRRLIPNSR